MPMTADSTNKILQELKALEHLLHSSASDNIPILNELVATISTSDSDAEALTISALAATEKPENPFLPKAVLERLSHEREAARQSAEEAQRTMQHVLERKHQQATQKLSMVEHPLSHEQQDALIE